MADQVQNIRIKYLVDDSELNKAKTSTKGLTDEEAKLANEFKKVNAEAGKANKVIQDGADKSSKSLSGLDSGIKNIRNTIIAAFTVDKILDFGKAVIETTAKFEKFEAVLTNTLGSKSSAQAALANIKDFAAKTPFAVDELTASFVKLANQGFKPTQNEMRKLGDLAASTGKSFDQLAEGIIDAQTGEFERLKEFGIRASKEGDQVKFTFKGVETQTKFTSDAIREYVLSLGDAVGVSGAMAAISETVGGKISNMGDSFDSLFNTIGSANSGVFKGVVESITSVVQGLEIALLTQEQLQKKLDDMETSGRKSQTFALLEKEIKQLTAVSESEGEARGLVLRNELIFLQSELADTERQIASAKKNLTSSAGSDFMEEIKQMEKEAQFKRDTIQEIDELLIASDKKEADRIKADADAKKKNEEEEKKRIEKKAKLLEEQFKKELELLKDKNVKESNLEKERYLNGETTKEEYSKNLSDIEIEGFENIRQLYLEFGKDVADIDKTILDIRLKNKESAAQKELKFEEEKQKTLKDEFEKAEKEISEAFEEQEKHRTKVAKEQQAVRDQIRDRSIELGTDIVNGFAELQSEKRDQELTQVEAARERELKGAGDNKKAQAEINKRFDEQERVIKRKAAIEDKAAALFSIGIATAVAAMKQVAAVPLPLGAPLLALVLAQGAIQAAFVAAKPIPKFNRGTKSVPGVDTGQDSVLAMLRPNEGVMPVDRMNDYRPAFDAIFDRKVPADMLNSFVMDYGRLGGVAQSKGASNSSMEKTLNKIHSALKNIKTAEIHLDKKGVTTFLKSASGETEILNNYFRMK